VDNCALTELRVDDGRVAVLRFNTPVDPRWNGAGPGRRPH
jgi:hypothetical protein